MSSDDAGSDSGSYESDTNEQMSRLDSVEDTLIGILADVKQCLDESAKGVDASEDVLNAASAAVVSKVATVREEMRQAIAERSVRLNTTNSSYGVRKDAEIAARSAKLARDTLSMSIDREKVDGASGNSADPMKIESQG